MIWLLMIVAMLVAWLDLLAWLALHADATLHHGQKLAQAILVIAVPVMGALIVLRLCELAAPGAGRGRLLPWPLNRLVQDQPLRRSMHGESFDDFRRRFWNL